MIRIALPLIVLAAAGCQEERPEPAPPALAGSCKSEGLDSLIGKTRSAETEAEAKRLSGAKTFRWISPGMAVTMDYRTDRLNLDLDAQGRITRVHCG